jgi:hypothetical protein
LAKTNAGAPGGGVLHSLGRDARESMNSAESIHTAWVALGIGAILSVVVVVQLVTGTAYIRGLGPVSRSQRPVIFWMCEGTSGVIAAFAIFMGLSRLL